MSLRRPVLPALVLVLAAACATPGQVRRVETQIAMMQREQERRDSIRAAELSAIIRLQRVVLDSLDRTGRQLASVKGEMSSEFVEVRRNFLQVQQLLGQSQAQLSRLRAEIEARQDMPPVESEPAATPPTGIAAPRTTPPTSTPSAGVPSAEQLYVTAQGQLQQGARGAARTAYRDLLRLHPTSPRVPDAFFGLAQTFEGEQPDSAATYFREVATNFADSPRAPRAMYKLGVMAEARGNTAEARSWYQRVVVDRWRGTDDYTLAEERLRRLP
jgi:TolA-binding protein